MKRAWAILWGAAFLLFLWGCDTASDESSKAPAPPRPAVQSAAPAPEAAGGTLRFYNWEDYLGADTLARFEKETGIKVDLAAYKSEEEILGALQSGLPDADLAVVSGSVAIELIRAGLLAPLDLALIPNRRHIREKFLRLPFDPGQRYAIPYLWGTTGVLYNVKRAPPGPVGWSLLWNPEHRGRLAMLNNSIDVMDAGCKVLGLPLSDPKLADWERVRAKLLEQKPLLAGYLDPMRINDLMVSGELTAAQAYSGDALTAAARNPDLAYAVPAEGSSFWVDLLVVPKASKRKTEAMRLINFIQTPEVMADIVKTVRFASVNEAADAFLPRELLETGVVPSKEVLDRCEFSLGVDDPEIMRLRMETWADLRSAE